MSRRWKIGDRVRVRDRGHEDIFGEGSIQGFMPPNRWMTLVLFDTDPPREFNMSENPTYMHTDWLERIK